MGDSTNAQVIIASSPRFEQRPPLATAEKLTQALKAGTIAAFTVDLLVYPLDTIKTRYQSQDFRNGFVQTATAQGKGKQARRQLFKGLYQGIGAVIFATLPAAGLFFISYESAKPAIRSAMPSATPTPLIHALASASAELASCVVLAPAEVIKQNAQMITQSTRGPDNQSVSIQALRKIWRATAGPARNMWTGYTVLVARNLPFTFIHFPLFEFVRAQIWARRARHPGGTDETSLKTVQDNGRKPEGVRPTVIETALVTGASAALSGALAALITTPADVVKTQVMLAAGEPGRGNDGGGGRENIKGFHIAKEIIREKGLQGVFRGGILRASWAALGGGLYLGSYEAAKVSLQGAPKSSRPDDGF